MSAQIRNDKFNETIKQFRMVQVKFRSPDNEKIAAAFEAISVLAQYRLEHGESLFYLLAGIEIEEYFITIYCKYFLQ